MSQHRHQLSRSIAALPAEFDLPGLVAAAAQLLRGKSSPAEPSGGPSSIPPPPPPPTISMEEVEQLIAQQLVDPPESGPRPFVHRHLLQIVAVQNLRSLGLPAARVRELVQGVDDSYLKMLCDEPAEAEKKAAVMSNWLKMLSNGRVGQADRGETQQLNAPAPHSAATVELHLAPPRPPMPKRVRGLAPTLELGRAPPVAPPPVGLPPHDLPDALPADFAPADRPNGPPAAPPHQPRTRELRGPRTTFAASQALTDALRAHTAAVDLDATPQVPLAAVSIARSPLESGATPPPSLREPAASEAMEDLDAVTAVAPILPQAWTRVRLADGVELHLQAGRQPLRASALATVMAQLRAILGEHAD